MSETTTNPEVQDFSDKQKDKTSGIKLSNFSLTKDAEEGKRFPLLDPETLEEIPGSFLFIASSESKKVEQARAEIHDSLSKKHKRKLPTKVLLDVNLKITAKAVLIGWSGIEADDGSGPLEATYENKLAMLTKHSWLNEQVTDYATERANFSGIDLGN